jgi:hypothetical protein
VPVALLPPDPDPVVLPVPEPLERDRLSSSVPSQLERATLAQIAACMKMLE